MQTMQAILNPATAAADFRAFCPAYVSPADLRPRKQAGPTMQVTARKIAGGKWEGIFRDTTGSGVESTNHATETDAIKAVAFYANTTGAA